MPTTSLSQFDAAAILMVLAAASGYLNTRLLKLLSSIGLTVMGALASLAVILIDSLGGNTLALQLAGFLSGIDFSRHIDGGHVVVPAIRLSGCRPSGVWGGGRVIF